jgi:archaellum component FlaF (FlaF/FlaG flagellin family)
LTSTISDGIVLIAVVISAVALSQSFLQSMNIIQTKNSESASTLSEKISTDIKIINAQVTSNSSLKIWVKNVGRSTIYPSNIADSDVFFGDANTIERLNYNVTGFGWTYIILNQDSSRWRPGETIEITITLGEPFIETNEYYVNMATHNGVKSSYFFG